MVLPAGPARTAGRHTENGALLVRSARHTNQTRATHTHIQHPTDARGGRVFDDLCEPQDFMLPCWWRQTLG